MMNAATARMTLATRSAVDSATRFDRQPTAENLVLLVAAAGELINAAEGIGMLKMKAHETPPRCGKRVTDVRGLDPGPCLLPKGHPGECQ